MNGLGHIIVGCSAGLAVMAGASIIGISVSSQSQVFTGMVLAGLAALGPDVDCQGSTINRMAIGLFVAGMVILGLVPFLSVDLGRQFFDSAWLRFLHAEFPRWSEQEWAGWTLLASALALVIIPYLVSHRGPTHSVMFTIGVTLAVLAAYLSSGIPAIFGMCFGAGWLSHLLADALSEEGLPEWDWPLTVWRE